MKAPSARRWLIALALGASLALGLWARSDQPHEAGVIDPIADVPLEPEVVSDRTERLPTKADAPTADVPGGPEVVSDRTERSPTKVDADLPEDERAFSRMQALVRLGDITGAREAATQFFERHPNSPFLPRVVRLTGKRPRPPAGPSRERR
jgi:hypothetical protein